MAAEPVFTQIQLLARHRRDLVETMTSLRCQIHEHLNMLMPRYAKGFDDVFESHRAQSTLYRRNSHDCFSFVHVRRIVQPQSGRTIRMDSLEHTETAIIPTQDSAKELLNDLRFENGQWRGRENFSTVRCFEHGVFLFKSE